MLASSLAIASAVANPCRPTTLAGRVLLQVACWHGQHRAQQASAGSGHGWLQICIAVRARAPCAPWALSSHTVILRAGHYFFRYTLVKNHHRSTDDLHLIHTAIHVLGIIHSHSDSDSTHDFAPPRGVATRRFRQPIADLGHMKGWLPFGVDLHYVPLLITEQMLIHKM